jgi:hypothetical protein
MADDLRALSLDEVTKLKVVPRDEGFYAVYFELQRRQILTQIEATEAAKRLAEEAASSASYAKQSVRWMKWSVIVLALASAASVIFDLFRIISLAILR